MVRARARTSTASPAPTLESKRTVMVRSGICAGAAVAICGVPPIAGGAAEPGIKRHRGERQPDHAGDQPAAQERDDEIAARSGGVVWFGAIICRLSARLFTAAGAARPALSPASRCRTGSPGGQATPQWRSSARGGRATARSVSLMPGSGLSSSMTIIVSAHHAQAMRPNSAAEHASIDQQHGKQQEQIEDREGEHLLAGGVRRSRRRRPSSAR